MGIAAMAVLIGSNFAISLLRKVIPDKVRIPCYIVIIAGFVTIVQMLVQAFFPELYKMLGVYLALITVNCIILGRAEMFAGKNAVFASALDGIGIGLGFTMALTILGLVREVLGSGSAFGYKFVEGDGILAFVLAPGAFLVLGYLLVIFKKLTSKKAE
jgi:electron transport complex protein RnfE